MLIALLNIFVSMLNRKSLPMKLVMCANSVNGLISTITNFIEAVLLIQHSIFKLQFLKLLL